MKNTICIYVIYDIQSVINPYIEAVLKELKRFAGRIYVVCNFSRISEGEQYIRPYAYSVIYRDNIGFDSGAFRDVINIHIGKDDISKNDELILTNDTYFAPIYPLDDMFNKMTETVCDYWGITRHPGGYNVDLGDFESHIQSYFLCFKQNVLQSDSFYRFWENFEYADNKAEAVMNFELGINRMLHCNGFIGYAYTDVIAPSFITDKGTNPYMSYAYELVSKYRIPIIKKTNFYGKNPFLINALKALEYIDKCSPYDASLISSYIDEYQRKGIIGSYYDFNEMEAFIQRHDRVYIYGAGVWGHIAADYMNYKHMDFSGFLVTEAEDNGAVAFMDANVSDTDGIIIAQEYKDVCDSIKKYISNRVKDEHIFTPQYP